MSLAELIQRPEVRIEAIARYLDDRDHAARWSELGELSRSQQRTLYEKATASPPIDLAHFVVAIRANDENWQAKGPGIFPREVWPRITLDPKELSAPSGKVMTYFMTPISISSTAIRNLVSEGQSIRYLTPDPVVEYIRSHRLYAKP